MQGSRLRASTSPWLGRLLGVSGLLRWARFASNPPSPPLLHIMTRDPCPASQVSSLSISSRILIGAPATFLRVYLLLVGAAGAPPRACVLSCAWVRAWRWPVSLCAWMRVVRHDACVLRARMCVRVLAAFIRRRVLLSGPPPVAAAATVAALAAASAPPSCRATRAALPAAARAVERAESPPPQQRRQQQQQ